MKNIHQYLLGSVVATLCIGCGGGNYENTDTTAQCEPIAPVLLKMDEKYADEKELLAVSSSGYEVTLSYKESEEGGENEREDDSEKSSGDDEGEEDESKGGIHNQGIACAKCHSFASGATVFSALHAANKTLGANGYKIQLGGSDVYSAGRGTGNSRLTRFSGGTFTANVIDSAGNIVNSSMANSHDASRLDCNRCHTASGSNGAPGRIVNKRIGTTNQTNTSTNVPATNPTTCTPASSSNAASTNTPTVSFTNNVMPILAGKCKSCHGSNGRFSVSSAGGTYANIKALKGSASASGKYLLDKGSNTIGHGGGRVISTSSGEYKTIRAWINAGATNN